MYMYVFIPLCVFMHCRRDAHKPQLQRSLGPPQRRRYRRVREETKSFRATRSKSRLTPKHQTSTARSLPQNTVRTSYKYTMCVYIYIYTYTTYCDSLSLYTYIYIYKYIYLYLSLSLSLYIYIYIYIYICTPLRRTESNLEARS